MIPVHGGVFNPFRDKSWCNELGHSVLSSSIPIAKMAQNLFQARPILTQKEVIWVIGLILGGIGYGALLTLGIACLVTFSYSRHTGRRWFVCEKILSVHVSLVLLTNTILQVWNAKSNVNAIFYTDPDSITFFYHDWENIFTVFLAMLTEGILVG